MELPSDYHDRQLTAAFLLNIKIPEIADTFLIFYLTLFLFRLLVTVIVRNSLSLKLLINKKKRNEIVISYYYYTYNIYNMLTPRYTHRSVDTLYIYKLLFTPRYYYYYTYNMLTPWYTHTPVAILCIYTLLFTPRYYYPAIKEAE